MKSTHAKFACARLEDIASKKRNKIIKEFRIEKMTFQERIDLVIDGDVDFKGSFLKELKETDTENNKRTGSNYYRSDPSFHIDSIWDFSSYEDLDVGDYREGYDEAIEQLANAVQNLKDQIWLGDEQEAMKLLEKFQKSD